MNATIRIAQGNPTRGMSWANMMGMTTPPTADPEMAMPSAAARRRGGGETRS